MSQTEMQSQPGFSCCLPYNKSTPCAGQRFTFQFQSYFYYYIQSLARQMHQQILQLPNDKDLIEILLKSHSRAKIMTLLLMSTVTRSKFVTHFFNSKVKIKHFPFFLFVHFTCISCLGSSCPNSCLQHLVLPFDFVFCEPFCNNYEYLINP